MFYERLKSIYSQNDDYLNNRFSFEQYYPILRLYLIEQVKSKQELLSVDDFANKNAISLRDSINFLAALSGEDGIFERHYKFNCEKCSQVHVIEEEELFEMINLENEYPEDIDCDYCNQTNFIPSNTEFIKLLFKIKPLIFKEISAEIKKVESSSEVISQVEISEGDYFNLETQIENLEEENPEQTNIKDKCKEIKSEMRKLI